MGTESSGDRDSNGRFTPGNPGGPGRPRRHVEVEYLGCLADAVPLDTWRKITERAVQNALAGEAKARDWLSRYLLGDGAKLEQLANKDAESERGMDFSLLSLEELQQLEKLLAKATWQTESATLPELAKVLTMLGPLEDEITSGCEEDRDARVLS